MKIHPYINFQGNARDAVLFYADVFGAEPPRIMTYGDMPAGPGGKKDESLKDKVMHAGLMVHGNHLFFSDVPPGTPFQAGGSITLLVESKDAGELKQWFQRMKEGGTVIMDIQETFWSKCYGYVTDKFGVGWQFNLDSGESA